MKNVAIWLLAAAVLFGQTETKRLRFEVVSIKPHKSAEDLTMMPFGVAGGRYTATNAHLRQLIAAAYVDSAFPLQQAEIDALRGWAAGRKVVGKTGLAGLHQIDLNFAPDPLPPGADPNLPSLFTALREQLGLRLVAETGQVDTFVVESVQKPTEN